MRVVKAIQIERTGGPEVMQLVDVSLGEAGPGEVLIRHHAIGLNFIDTYHRSGLYAARGGRRSGRLHVQGSQQLRRGADRSSARTRGERSLNCLQPLGLMVSFGNASGPVPPVALAQLSAKGSLYVHRPSTLHTHLTSALVAQQMAGELFEDFRRAPLRAGR